MRGAATKRTGRCFRAVDSISDEAPKFIAINEKTDYEIVHRRRLIHAPDDFASFLWYSFVRFLRRGGWKRCGGFS
jgi:hypothetical protein